jgi:uncharacterized membrane protein
MTIAHGTPMKQPTRSEAQQRADEIRVFQRECERLRHEGVLELSAAQACAVSEHHAGLLARYAETFDIDASVKAKQLSLGMRVASFLGALALAASVLFLFYQFWGGFGTVAQVGLLICAALASFAATLWIQGKDHSGYFTKLAAMLAFVCFVLNIFMLGQIFNITPSDKALIPWAMFAFLLAYSCDLRLLLAAGILCVIAYISARTGTWGGMYWLHFGERPENFFPAALLFFVLPSFLHRQRSQAFDDFAPIYRVFGLLTLLLPVLVLSHWGDGSYLDFDANFIEGAYQVFGFVVSACAIWLGARRGWPDVINTGITFFVIFLYTKLYDWCWELMPKYLFFLVVGLVAVLILFVLKRLRTATAPLSSGDAS